MLSENVRVYFERAITTAFSNSPEKSFRGYWCDGILDPEWEQDYLPDHVKNTKQLVTRAWIDEGRRRNTLSSTQRLYQLVLLLGQQAYNHYIKKGLFTQQSSATIERITLEPAAGIITIQLL